MNIKPDYVSDDGSVKLYRGDCLDIMPILREGCVDAVVTDPPYGKVNRSSGGLRNLDKGAADVVTFDLNELVAHLSRISSGSVYVWCGTEQVSGLRAGFVQAGMSTRMCGWEKSNPSPMNGEKLWLSSFECCVFARHSKAFFSRHCESPIWRGAIQRDQVHPTQKPLWLIGNLVDASADTGHTVFDPFMGSGTTGVACVKLGRKFIGIELDPGYFDIAVKRIESAFADGGLFNGKMHGEEQLESGGGE